MKITQIADDLTGRIIASGEETEELAITIDGKKITLDLSEDSATALKALGTPEGPKLFASIFGSKPSTGTSDATKIRAWHGSLGPDRLKELGIDGIELKSQGQVPVKIRDAYESDQK